MSLTVVHVVRQYSPSVGGIENFVQSLCAELRKEGVQSHIVTLNRTFDDRSRRLPASEVIDGIPVNRISYVGGRRLFLAPEVLRHIGEGDVVHVHAIDLLLELVALTKWWHRKPIVVSTHGGFFHTPFLRPLKQLMFHTLTRSSLARVDRVFACSESDYRSFSRVTKRCELLPNAVDVTRYLNLQHRPVRHRWLCVGRVAPSKRLDRLVETVSHLASRWPDLRLDVVGPNQGGLTNELTALAERLRVGRQVRFHGRVSAERLENFYSKAECFVSASEYEGFGIATVEAMASGVIPLVNDIDSLRSFVRNGETGLVTDFANPERAAADIFGRLPPLLERSEQISEASRQRARRYDWSEAGRKWAGVYRDVVGHERRQILGVPFTVTNTTELTRQLDDCIQGGRQCRIAIANAHTLNQASTDPSVLGDLRTLTLVNDGVGVDLASRKLYRAKFPENLEGTDLVPRLLRALRSPVRVYLLGGRPRVADAAGATLAARQDTLTVTGTHHGFFSPDESAAVIEKINAAKPDVLLVGLGNPLQEHWMAMHGKELDVPVCVAVGGLFDFLSGRTHRAPVWMRKLRFEWLFRLLMEPRRMWRRYLIGNLAFLRRVWVYGHRSVHDGPGVGPTIGEQT